jgi:hypothetical protein
MPEDQPKQRGTLLTLWLVIMMISSAFYAYVYIAITYALVTNNQAILKSYPLNSWTIPIWAAILFSILNVVNICSVIALFKWRKWGFYTFCVSAAVGVMVNFALGVGPTSVFGLLGISILGSILVRKWNMLK